MSNTATPTAPASRREPTLTEEQKHKWLTNRQGKDHLLYAALLEIAHNQFFIKGMKTELVQIGSAANDHVYIVHATASFPHGDFEGFGEVDLGIEKNMVAKANPLRMAETRAKARALRDGVNASAWEVEGDPTDDLTTVRPTVDDARKEFEGMLSRQEDRAPVSIKEVLKSLKSEPSPRERSLIDRSATPLDEDLVPTLPVALRKWEITVKLANGLGVRIPIMTDAQMADPMELQIEGRKLSRAVGMKQVEKKQAELKAAAEQRSGA